jgi:hypothetical protein
MYVDVEISLLDGFSDVLCYFYVDLELVDAFSLTNEDIIACIPYKNNKISVVVKDTAEGCVMVREDLILEASGSKVYLIPQENPVLKIQTYIKSDLNPSKKSDFPVPLEKTNEFEEAKRQDYLFLNDFIETNKFNSDGFIKDINSMVYEHLSYIKTKKKQKNVNNVIKCPTIDFTGIEKQKILAQCQEKLSQDIYKQSLKITKLKTDNRILVLELESCQNDLKLQRLKNKQTINTGLLQKLCNLMNILDTKSKQLIQKQQIHLEVLKELKSLQQVSKTLQNYLKSLIKVTNPSNISPKPPKSSKRSNSTQ